MAEKKRPHLQTAKRNISVAEQSCKKSSSIGKTASVPHLYYIVPRAKTVLFCTKNTSLNETGNQFSQTVFITLLVLLTLSRETIFRPSGQKLSFYIQARKHRKTEENFLNFKVHCTVLERKEFLMAVLTVESPIP